MATIRSKLPSAWRSRSLAMARSAVVPARQALMRVNSSARRLMSSACTHAAGQRRATWIAAAPLPQPMSATRRISRSAWASSQASMAWTKR
ncbi:hypothetical protein D3C76_1273600 [compost metagenome]